MDTPRRRGRRIIEYIEGDTCPYCGRMRETAVLTDAGIAWACCDRWLIQRWADAPE